MKRIWIGALGLTLAMVMGGCGSETPAAATDAGSATDSGAATDSGTATDAGGDDVSTTSDAGGTDTSTGATDTASGTPDVDDGKCAPTDNQCVQACIGTKCATEATACNQDKKCTGMLTCLSGCADGIEPTKPSEAVKLPNGNTPTTCNEWCIAIAGSDASTKYANMALCGQSKCLKTTAGQNGDCVEGSSNYNQCLSQCAPVKCSTEYNKCTSNPDCIALNTCLGKCTDQTCQQGCVAAAKGTAGQDYQAMVVCALDKCTKK